MCAGEQNPNINTQKQWQRQHLRNYERREVLETDIQDRLPMCTQTSPASSRQTQNGDLGLTQFDAELQRVIRRKTHAQSDVQWAAICPLYGTKLDHILTAEYRISMDSIITDPLGEGHDETIQHFRDRLVTAFNDKFTQSPPFTITRLAEVLQQPKELYSTADKFLRALDNIACVSSTTANFGATTALHEHHDVERNDAEEKEVPVTVGDEAQTILLSKIDWLTDDDIKEIEGETYLADLTTPLEDVVEDESPEGNGSQQEQQDENGHQHGNGHAEQQAEDEAKKRKADGQSDLPQESPEKKSKTESRASTAEIEDAEDTPECDQEVNPDETLPEDKMDESLILDDDKTANASIIMEDASEAGNETAGNDTLPEDKMDVDG